MATVGNMMMFAKEMKQLNNTAVTAFAESKLSGGVRFSILQIYIFCNED